MCDFRTVMSGCPTRAPTHLTPVHPHEFDPDNHSDSPRKTQ
ncbi:hypothetical protein ABZ606_30460 [Streptomyces sp. NPDC012461]|nr:MULTISPECIES: hypothetical protein [unclassified Streptomyces]